MQIRLDYNNRVEVWTKNNQNTNQKSNCYRRLNTTKSFDLNAIKKRFNIEENN